MKKTLLVIVIALATFVCGCATLFSPKYSARGPKLDTSTWEEHYVGRYTLRLPVGSKTTLSTKYWALGVDGTKFEYLEGVKKNDVPRIVAARVTELQNTKNRKTLGSMFLNTIDLPNGGVGILRWESPASDAQQTLECYLFAKEGQEYVFKFVHVGVLKSDPDYIMMNYTDKKIIRRGKHNAGNIPGQEICVSGVRDGFTAFECQWGSPGKYKDLSNQELNLITQVRPHEGRGVYPTQEELLLLWDTIIGTIRLRPGAV